MGEKTKTRDADPNFEVLAEALTYLGDQVRAGLDNLSEAIKSRPTNLLAEGVELRSADSINQIRNQKHEGQDKNQDFSEWKAGADEIPDMRDDDPLPDFGRKPGT